MYVYIFVAVLLIFALWKERQALGCPEGLTLADCNNAEGKAIKGTKSLPSDSTEVVVDKIKRAADFADRWVMWRIGFLVSFPCVVLIYFFVNSTSTGGKTCTKLDDGTLFCALVNNFPSEKELVIGMFVITALVYFTLNFYKFHLINYAKKNIDDGVDILASRVR